MSYLIQQTETFLKWYKSLRDLRAKIGNLGDVKPVGRGVSEFRINVGAGYRVYFTMRSGVVVLLLAGGNKSTQQTDIEQAKRLAKEVQYDTKNN